MKNNYYKEYYIKNKEKIKEKKAKYYLDNKEKLDNKHLEQIDHIKEVHTFDKDTPQYIVNALSNLQPLWKEENIKKHYGIKSSKNIKR